MGGGLVSEEEAELTLQAIEQEADRLNKMVGNILDLSRLEAGAWRPRQEIIDLSEIVGAALDSFDSADNSRIEVVLESQQVEMMADSVQMVQVLRNLLENALKYSPLGSKVYLRSRKRDGRILIEIVDKGPGLPKGEEQRIFEPFYRARGLNESAVPGVGIGLAICLALVEANGGALTAYNGESEGAIFCVSMPVHCRISDGKI